jgi:hypothetical protein
MFEARCRAPGTPQGDVKQAQIVLLAAEGRSTRSIAGVQPRIVSKWRPRFLLFYCISQLRKWYWWEGKPFNLKKVTFIRHAYKLASRHERLRRRGMLTTREVAAKFGVSETAVHEWGRQGLITKCCSDNLSRGPVDTASAPDHPQRLWRSWRATGAARPHHRAIIRTRCSMRQSSCHAPDTAVPAQWQYCSGPPSRRRCG